MKFFKTRAVFFIKIIVSFSLMLPHWSDFGYSRSRKVVRLRKSLLCWHRTELYECKISSHQYTVYLSTVVVLFFIIRQFLPLFHAKNSLLAASYTFVPVVKYYYKLFSTISIRFDLNNKIDFFFFTLRLFLCLFRLCCCYSVKNRNATFSYCCLVICAHIYY